MQAGVQSFGRSGKSQQHESQKNNVSWRVGASLPTGWRIKPSFFSDKAPRNGAAGADAVRHHHDEGSNEGEPAADDASVQSANAKAAAASRHANGVEDARTTLGDLVEERRGPSQGPKNEQGPGPNQGLDDRPSPSQGLDNHKTDTSKSGRNTGIFGNTQGLFPKINQSKVPYYQDLATEQNSLIHLPH